MKWELMKQEEAMDTTIQHWYIPPI